MALTDKDIVITPNRGQANDPQVVFSCATASASDDITLYGNYTTNAVLSFEGSAGQLFSISNDLTGSIFSVNDVSGIPSIEVNADGTVSLAEFGGNVGIGTASPSSLLEVTGKLTLSSSIYDNHLRFVRFSEDWKITPSTDGSLDIIRDAGTGTAYVDVPNLRLSNDVFVNSGSGFVNSGQWTRNATPYGYIDIGPANTSYAHLYTDRPSFYFNKNLLVNGSTVWTSGNDGSGSGLDADTLDGVQGASYLRSDTNDTFTGVLDLNGRLDLQDANTSVYIGTSAGQGATGAGNVAIGGVAFDATGCTAGNSVIIGRAAGTSVTSGNNNIFIGRSAGLLTTTGQNNTVIGYQAFDGTTTGSWNCAFGLQSLRVATATTGYNVAMGYRALFNTSTGVNNTGIGAFAGDVITTGTNNTCIGYEADAPGSASANTFTLGNSSVSNLRCNDTSISSLSDVRDKTNITDLDWGLDFIDTLRPVKFDWNRRDGSFEGRKDLGFIAQELQTVEDQFNSHDYTRLVHTDNPDKLEADPMKTYPILIKAVQELSAKVKYLQDYITNNDL